MNEKLLIRNDPLREKSTIKISDEVIEQAKHLFDPDVVRLKFSMMGLFLVAHEMLVYSVESPLKNFFGDFTGKKSVLGDDYEKEVIGRAPKKANRNRDSAQWLGSIQWLKDMSVISESDMRTIRKIRDTRNEIAHELPELLLDKETAPLMENLIENFWKAIELITKIDRWWIAEVEMDEPVEKEEIKLPKVDCLALLYDVIQGKNFSDDFEKMRNST